MRKPVPVEPEDKASGINTSGTKASRPSVLKAISWTSAATALSSLIVFLRAPILARLLTPEDYGLFGLTTTVMTGVTALTSFGFSQALIVRKSPDGADARELVDSTWTADFLRRCGITILLLLLAYPSALYFQEPRVFPLLALAALTPAISGLQNIGLVLLRKQVAFRGLAYFRVLTEFFTTVISIVVAYYTRDAWALVIGQVGSALLSALVSYAFHPHKPRFRLNRAVLAESISFGRQLYFAGVLTFVTTQFDSLVVGKYLGAAVLGAYAVAYRLASLPVDILSESLGTVLFPAVARTRNDAPHSMGDLLHKGIVIQMAGLAAMILPLRLAADDFIRFVYGSAWNSAVPILTALTVLTLCRGWCRAFTPFLQGMGRADFETRAKFFEVALFIPLTIYGVSHYGATGAALGGTVSYFASAVARLTATLRLFPKETGPVLRTIATVLGLMIGAYACAYLSIEASGFGLVGAAVFDLVFLGGIALCFRHLIPDFRKLVRR